MNNRIRLPILVRRQRRWRGPRVLPWRYSVRDGSCGMTSSMSRLRAWNSLTFAMMGTERQSRYVIGRGRCGIDLSMRCRRGLRFGPGQHARPGSGSAMASDATGARRNPREAGRKPSRATGISICGCQRLARGFRRPLIAGSTNAGRAAWRQIRGRLTQRCNVPGKPGRPAAGPKDRGAPIGGERRTPRGRR